MNKPRERQCLIRLAATAASQRSKHAQPELRYFQVEHQMNVMMSSNDTASARSV
ncbi:hypothetical protein [Vibrio sp. B1FIG11]|uniref:hypothetical protein n=1 Tax=Vibrio sp. B1FIG11 TaxID=2751177 RepID=UPI001BB05AAC|nr:hypothetical protein [Vibrio sp. B1FIG11]